MVLAWPSAVRSSVPRNLAPSPDRPPRGDGLLRLQDAVQGLRRSKHLHLWHELDSLEATQPGHPGAQDCRSNALPSDSVWLTCRVEGCDSGERGPRRATLHCLGKRPHREGRSHPRCQSPLKARLNPFSRLSNSAKHAAFPKQKKASDAMAPTPVFAQIGPTGVPPLVCGGFGESAVAVSRRGTMRRWKIWKNYRRDSERHSAEEALRQ